MSASDGAIVPPRAGLVLVVDDDPSIRLVATRILQYGGYRVAAAASVADALSACEREQPDLVLCDWHMPIANGSVLLQELRARHGAEAPLFAFVSAHHAQAELAQLEGVIAVVGKPFTMEQLLGLVARFVEPRPGSIAAMKAIARPPGTPTD